MANFLMQSKSIYELPINEKLLIFILFNFCNVGVPRKFFILLYIE